MSTNEQNAKAESDELSSPQTLEAYRAARSGLRVAGKRIYLLEQQLESARRSNGRMVEQMHADRDRAAALSAELDEVRAGHAVAIGIVQTALDAANRKVDACEGYRFDLNYLAEVGDFVVCADGSELEILQVDPEDSKMPYRVEFPGYVEEWLHIRHYAGIRHR